MAAGGLTPRQVGREEREGAGGGCNAAGEQGQRVRRQA